MLRIVAFIGVDGSGKTTQAHLLAGRLTEAGTPARYWRNASGRRWFGRLAQRLRRRDAEDLLGASGLLAAESVLRGLAMVRALAWSRLRGRVAVMDRYTYCQYARVRAHDGRSDRWVRRLYRLFPEPDVIFHLTMPPDAAHQRVEARATDHEELSYLAASEAAYRSLPEAPGFTVVDANRSPGDVHGTVWAALTGAGAGRGAGATSGAGRAALPVTAPVP